MGTRTTGLAASAIGLLAALSRHPQNRPSIMGTTAALTAFVAAAAMLSNITPEDRRMVRRAATGLRWKAGTLRGDSPVAGVFTEMANELDRLHARLRPVPRGSTDGSGRVDSLAPRRAPGR